MKVVTKTQSSLMREGKRMAWVIYFFAGNLFLSKFSKRNCDFLLISYINFLEVIKLGGQYD